MGEGGVVEGDGVFQMGFLAEPFAVAGSEPGGEVGAIDAVEFADQVLDACNDDAVILAFAQGLVDDFADLARQAGDVVAGTVEVVRRRAAG